MKKLSIIVTAHNRKKYLPYAIKSILSSTKKIDDLEIIVVKNFEDEDLDSWLKSQNVKIFITDQESLAAKQVLGIVNAQGDLISFLEDDDMFALNKIHVLRKLLEYPDLDFFHHLVKPIKGDIYLSETVPFNDTDLEIFRVEDLENKVKLNYIIKKYHPEIYNSSKVISKDLARKCIDGLKGVDINTERFWFLCALEKGRLLAVTSSPLTLYRIHGESFSQPNSKLFKVKLLERYIQSYIFMMKYFQKEITKQILDEQYKLHIAHYLIYKKDERMKKLRLALSLIGNSLKRSTTYKEYSLLSALALLSSLASISLARKILYR